MKETIKKQVKINAPASTVWKILMDNELNKEWYSEFNKGSYAVSNWKVGSSVKYFDSNGYGLISSVIANVPHKIISVEHKGVLLNNKEDYRSDEAAIWKGCLETYKLEEINNETMLEISVDTPAKYIDSMTLMWDKALLKINEMAKKIINS